MLARLHLLEVWHLAVASFVNGVAWATDNPVRRVMIGEAVGATQMGTAMSIDVGANNASRMVGPIIGGLLLAERRHRRRVHAERRALHGRRVRGIPGALS